MEEHTECKSLLDKNTLNLLEDDMNTIEIHYYTSLYVYRYIHIYTYIIFQ